MKVSEQRTVDVDVGSIRTEGNTLRGHAAVFNVLSEDLGGFKERIAPGAFSGVLDADVRLLVDHKPPPLARTKAGTLRLSEDDTGLAFEADLPDTTYARDLKQSITRGDLDGMSFRFTVAPDGEQWADDVRTITRVDSLADVCLATYPAYAAASVELRTRNPKESSNAVNDDGTPTANATETTSTGAPNPAANTSSTGGLRVEDRTAATSTPTIEEAVVEFVRGTKRGEARSLTTAIGVSQAETSTRLFEKLRASSVFLSTGVNVIATDSDSVVFPQLTADTAPAAYGEGDAITPGDPTIGTITATPRKYAHLVQMSNELVDDSDPSIIEILRQNLTTTLGNKLDLDFFEGSGTAPVLKGLKNVSSIQTETAVGSFTNLDWVASVIAKLETEDVPKPYVMVTSPRTLKRFRTIKTGVASSVEPLLEGPLAGRDIPFSVYGVPVYSSSQLSITEGVGTNENSAYIYSPSSLYVVRRSEVAFEVDRSRLFNSDQTEVRIKTRLDLLAPTPKSIVRASGILA